MKSNAHVLMFGLKFAVVFGLLFAGFEAARGTRFEEFVIHDVVIAKAAALIDSISSGEAVRVEGHSLVTSDSRLRITRGCEGVEMLLLLTAGILAFPASVQHRARGLLIGFILVYALTLARLVLLHFALRYKPAAWEMLHGLILPLGPVLLIALYFLHWSASGTARPRMDRPVHAS